MIQNTTIMEVKRGRCPHCDKEFAFTRYPVVYAAESLEVAKKFTNEEGIVVECPNCNGQSIDKYPLYYVDNQNKTWLIYAPNRELADEMLAKLSSYEGDFSRLKYVGEVKVCVVGSWNAFARKVQGLIQRMVRRQKLAKNACDVSIQTNTRLWQS